MAKKLAWVVGMVSLSALILAPLTYGLQEAKPANPGEMLTPATKPTRTLPPRKPAELVTIQKGTLPIILSAPHGGTMPVPDTERRTGANVPRKRGAKNNFTTAFDRNVDHMALRIADEIEKLTGQRPYIVVANFSRRYIDANRMWTDAYESPIAAKYYHEYHDAIENFRKEILEKNRRGLILDIHGHGGDPESLIRGTADWATVKNMVDFFGKEALTGPEGLLGPIEAAGFKINPPNSEDTKLEVQSLNGGFITRNYGSFQGGAFDSVQWELGNAYRTADGIDKFAPVAADALVKFWKNYLIEGQGKLSDIERGPATQPAPADAP